MTNRQKLKKYFPNKSIIGMIHVKPLPGSVGCDGDFDQILSWALEDLNVYLEANIDAVIIENMADVPYAKPPLKKETVDAMIRIAKKIRQSTDIPIGIQMLEAANCDAMTIAATAGLDFIRAEGYVYAHIGGAGIIEGSARNILELRKELNAENVAVFADVKKKHCAHALTADLSVSDVVKQTDFFCADGVIITGGFTGEPAEQKDLRLAASVTKLPILIGSGVTADNFAEYYDLADGFIVGTYFKEENDWRKPPVREKIEKMIRKRDRLLKETKFK